MASTFNHFSFPTVEFQLFNAQLDKKARACMRIWECWQLCAISEPQNTLSLATAQIANNCYLTLEELSYNCNYLNYMAYSSLLSKIKIHCRYLLFILK